MFFAAPLALLGLLALPAILLLLRLNPPPARRVKFPPLALLRNLAPEQRTPHRMPLWLLLLRLAAAALLIIGIAGPSVHPPPALPGTGPILLVIDNGWAAAADWPSRLDTARRIVAGAAQSGRAVSILATAPEPSGAAPHIEGLMTTAQAGQMVDALQPQPLPADRNAAAAALQSAIPSTRLYIADGITDGPGFPEFLKTLHPDRIYANGHMPNLLLAPTMSAGGTLTAHLLGPAGRAHLLAKTASGNVLFSTGFDPAGNAAITLPLALSNQLAALTLASPVTAATTQLLDSSAHSTLIGLTAGGPDAETPFLGPLYFIRRAIPAGAQIVSSNFSGLLNDKANVIIMADSPLSAADQATARDWISQGGVLIRFAGPLTAAAPDALTPDPILAGDRRLGGALSWAKSQTIEPFPVASPLHALSIDPNATISRQVLADPTTLDPSTVWAVLSDGTPLVLGKQIGQGYLVSVLTTANADWSNLALSGLFPAMLTKLSGISRGTALKPNLSLPLQARMSAFGALLPATGNANITAAALPGTMISPAYPAGSYGQGANTIALNLGGHIPPPVTANLPDPIPLTGETPPENLGADLLGTALALLSFDLIISILLRGLIKMPQLALLAFLLIPLNVAHAQTAAVQTTLGYILTGDPATDQLSADGLAYLSAEVSAHTAAQIGSPAGLDPATGDLALYPLIYWPVLPSTPAPAPPACNALTDYMAHGGLLVIDSTGGDADAPGSGAGFAPGTNAALARVTACLALPALEPLTSSYVLAHCFYILLDFPGKFIGAPVYIASAAGRDADDVTPVVIGQNFWAAAWARDTDGNPEQSPIPGGEDQRVLADRFGTNLVIYALTGSYKADRVSAPALLDRLGQ